MTTQALVSVSGSHGAFLVCPRTGIIVNAYHDPIPLRCLPAPAPKDRRTGGRKGRA